MSSIDPFTLIVTSHISPIPHSRYLLIYLQLPMAFPTMWLAGFPIHFQEYLLALHPFHLIQRIKSTFFSNLYVEQNCLQKNTRITRRSISCSVSTSQSIKLSSAYCKCVISICQLFIPLFCYKTLLFPSYHLTLTWLVTIPNLKPCEMEKTFRCNLYQNRESHQLEFSIHMIKMFSISILHRIPGFFSFALAYSIHYLKKKVCVKFAEFLGNCPRKT